VVTHCALVGLSEVDDIHLASTTAPGAIVVPGAVTVAAALRNRDPDALAAAMIAGYELMVRFGQAIDGPSVLYRGIWPTYFATPLGIAAVAARLLDLDVRQCAHALPLIIVYALARAKPRPPRRLYERRAEMLKELSDAYGKVQRRRARAKPAARPA